ncbi:type VI secretion system ATPase TssH [Rhizobium straminoryzae]|uniref:Type VI secretion system ATPase TssH n=1 Tax=Rhizobium straminoryzae TaxID=1387186 RepID=A0A549TFT9_9HYPH|nr:type VI secretion system ATPase TssH [Rhizobium straminoryzae]TRL41360.1 type VI secretion system ATPase TssH [Rhizobium straminoryzae]
MPYIDLERLVGRLDGPARVGLETGASIAARLRHSSVEVIHWVRGLLDLPDLGSVFAELGLDIETLRGQSDASIADLGGGDGTSLVLSQNILTVCREAWLLASLEGGREVVTLPDVITALIDEASLRAYVRGAAPALLRVDRDRLDALRMAAQSRPSVSHDGPGAATATTGFNEFLRLYTRDMTADARSGKLDAVIGRQQELRQVIDILMRRRQNNPILVGEPGVGKTAIVEALALGIAGGDVPERLRNVRLLLLDLTLLQAGAGVKGEFERRLHGVVDAVRSSPEPIILFIDEAHGLIGAGGQPGQGDAANILKPALARGELRTIAATTWSEYKRHIEKDAALTRRFQLVQVLEPNEATAIQMVRGIAPGLKKHHGVRIRDEAIRAAVQLTARYLPARQLPDKAISVLDTAAAAVAMARQTTPGALADLRNELDLLGQERDWLSREPATAANMARLSDIDTETASIMSKIASLETRLEAEGQLCTEADRVEQTMDGDPDIRNLPVAGRGVDTTNVTPLSPVTRAGESPLATLKQLERAIADIAGEERLVPRVVDRDVVAAIVSRWTGIPVGKLLSDQIAAVRTLDEQLKQRVLGQDHVMGRIAQSMRAAKAGLSDPTRPPGVFLLVGMSGTGKTETALSVADMLYGGSQHLTVINMSEFKEEHKISMLLGSPPGYVGYGEGGVLTEAVRRRPYGVLLLDEIDKAHPGVHDIFYQVFDKGSLRDGEGRDIDFRNTTIFMTANTGSELLATLAADPDTMPQDDALEALLLPELQRQFKTAFLGRTTILPFMPLSPEALLGIIDIHLMRIATRVKAAYGATLTVHDNARSVLCSRARHSEMGARAIEVMIMRDLMPALSSALLDGLTNNAQVQNIDIRHDGEDFQVDVLGQDAAIESVDVASGGVPDEVAPARKGARGGERRRADAP